MDALLAPEGVPPAFLAPCPDAREAAALAQQPWYRVLYIAQVPLYAPSKPFPGPCDAYRELLQSVI
jgi:hypothetical protein